MGNGGPFPSARTDAAVAASAMAAMTAEMNRERAREVSRLRIGRCSFLPKLPKNRFGGMVGSAGANVNYC